MSVELARNLGQEPANVRSFLPRPYRHIEDVQRDGIKGFVVAGFNRSADLIEVTSITGVTFDRLDKRAENISKMKNVGSFATVPGDAQLFDHFGAEGSVALGARRSHGDYSSDPAGWMQPGQKIRDLLIADNRTIEEAGTTHQKLTGPILKAMELILDRQNRGEKFNKREPIKTEVDGEQLQFSAFSSSTSMGFPRLSGGWVGANRGETQGSLFNDQLFASYHFTATNLKTGKSIELSALTVHLIYRYGFYQGGPFRVDPSALIDFWTQR